MSGHETEAERKARERAERIAQARADLAARYAADPTAVERFNAKMARLAKAAKRERERIDHLVMGKPRPLVRLPGAKGRGRRKVKPAMVPIALEPEIQRAVELREQWSHKHASTPQTEAAAAGHTDALIQMERNGTLSKEQVEWVAQIANVHRSIEADVAVNVASLEARVDESRRGGEVGERIHRVRMHLAYTFWRDMVPAPKGLVLDMTVGDVLGYRAAAKRYRVHNRKAKRLLIEAIDRWPLCVAHAFSRVDQSIVDAMNDARRPFGYEPDRPTIPVSTSAGDYQIARAVEAGREATDEPYLLPKLDAAFLDEKGHLLPWADIAAVIRKRTAADV